jgi:hypothetical protein
MKKAFGVRLVVALLRRLLRLPKAAVHLAATAPGRVRAILKATAIPAPVTAAGESNGVRRRSAIS